MRWALFIEQGGERWSACGADHVLDTISTSEAGGDRDLRSKAIVGDCVSSRLAGARKLEIVGVTKVVTHDLPQRSLRDRAVVGDCEQVRRRTLCPRVEHGRL